MSRKRKAVFAVPGNLSAPTGGYHYDRSLLAALRALDREVAHLPLPGGFPFPDARDMREASDMLIQVPEDRALIIDGLAFGAMDTSALDRVAAPMIALVHHPLAHESDLPKTEARRLRDLECANLRRCAHVLVPSPHIADVLVTDYDVKRCDITVIRPGRPEVGGRVSVPEHPNSAPLILSVGLLHPRKGHDVLIAALAELAHLDWRAVIVGAPWAEGYEAALTDQIAKAGLSGRVRLAGWVPEDELNALYAEAEILALATRYEGYGIVFDEALIRGLPVVATTAGAVPGTVPEGAGRLVPPDDAVRFAAALAGLLEDEAARAAMARAALDAGAALPDWAVAARAVSDILDRVAAGRGSA